MKSYFVITFGCQMNKSDSERVSAIFEQLNYSVSASAEEADYVVINACSVRQTAMNRVWSLLAKFEEVKTKKDVKTILTGCVLPADKKKLKDKFDFVFNIKELFELEKFLSGQKTCSGDYLKVKPKYSNKYQALVPIMTGCNNYCSYCAVPYVRGRETSRFAGDVLNEIRELAKNGCKEVTLLGQNVNSYEPVDEENFNPENPYTHKFARLLWEVSQINGLDRVYFAAAHPKDMDPEVIHALSLPRMGNYIHLALQSGDDEILEAMNRQYTGRDYFNLLKKIRKYNKSIAIGTDIIVGFPGESRQQFENTLNFYKKAKFDISFNAVFSPRPGTKAAELKDTVPQEEKKARWRELHDLMEEITLQKNKRFLGKRVSVLIDKVEKDYVEGNSREMKRVRIDDTSHKLGDIVNIEIKEPKTWILQT